MFSIWAQSYDPRNCLIAFAIELNVTSKNLFWELVHVKYLNFNMNYVLKRSRAYPFIIILTGKLSI